MKTWEVISIVCSALIAGMFYGPWAALSRSLKTFAPEVFLAVVNQMNRNMAPLMTVLMPVALLSMVPVLLYSYHAQMTTFYCYSAAFVLFVVALAVTVFIEVPIVEQIAKWTVATLPEDWKEVRDRWMRFHIVRVVAGLTSLLLLVVGAILQVA
jgi:uncharacterized membrane protein